MSESLQLFLRRQVDRYEPYDLLSFLQGIEAACFSFGVWKDGTQWLGAGAYTVREMREAIEKFKEAEL